MPAFTKYFLSKCVYYKSDHDLISTKLKYKWNKKANNEIMNIAVISGIYQTVCNIVVVTDSCLKKRITKFGDLFWITLYVCPEVLIRGNVMLKFYKTIAFQRIATFEEATKVRVTGLYTELDDNFQASYFQDFFSSYLQPNSTIFG